MTIELMHDIAALRRLQPHNLLTLRVCDALEKALTKSVLTADEQPEVKVKIVNAGDTDRKMRNQYMREYMRRRRETAKPSAA